MKATEASFLQFLKKSTQFVIPIYQRTYSWTAKECGQLWADIIRAGMTDDISAHFVGSVVYVEKGLYQVSSQTPLLCHRRAAAADYGHIAIGSTGAAPRRQGTGRG